MINIDMSLKKIKYAVSIQLWGKNLVVEMYIVQLIDRISALTYINSNN